MFASVKTMAIGLLGLTLVVWFLAIQSHKPVSVADSAAVSEQSSPPIPPVARETGTTDFGTMPPVPDAGGLSQSNALVEESVGKTPDVAESWAEEMRELKELAARDPEAALAWVMQEPTKEDRDNALKEVCLQVAEKDPARAMDAAWSLELGKFNENPSDGRALEQLAGKWAAVDLPAALAWADEQPVDEEGRRDLVIKGIASAWSQTDPVDAARLVVTQMSPDEHAQFEAAMAVVGQWAALDFSGAKAWVDLFPEGPIRDRGNEELSKAVANQEPPATPSN
jgi:hypothetical protein